MLIVVYTMDGTAEHIGAFKMGVRSVYWTYRISMSIHCNYNNYCLYFNNSLRAIYVPHLPSWTSCALVVFVLYHIVHYQFAHMQIRKHCSMWCVCLWVCMCACMCACIYNIPNNAYIFMLRIWNSICFLILGVYISHCMSADGTVDRLGV